MSAEGSGRARRLGIACGVAALFFALGFWPLRVAVASGAVAGAGPDVAVTLWGMWWYTHETVAAAWWGSSKLANFPDGVLGGVLAPLTTTLWQALDAALGPGPATTGVGGLTLALWCASVAWLARLTGLGSALSVLAGVLALEGRYLVFALGETSVVGITALPVLWAAAALLSWDRDRRPAWLALYAVAAAATGLEYPYLVGLPPLLGAAFAVHRRSRVVGVAVGLGVLLGVLALAATSRGQQGTFGSLAQQLTVTVGRWSWPRGEHEFARALPAPLVLPGAVVWSTTATSSAHATGRDYLGLPLILFAVVGLALRPRRTWPFALLAAIGIALATGSEWFGLPGPFALLNAVAARVVRVLTQPTRFLVLSSACLPILAAHGLAALRERRLVVAAGVVVLVADAFAFGGLSLTLPTMELPSASCVAALREQPGGAVALWPWDGLDGGEASIRQREWQVVHGHPSPGRGVGSWTLLGAVPGTRQLAKLGLEQAVFGEGPVEPGRLAALGYGWVVADLSAGDWVGATARASLGEPTVTCDGAEVYVLSLQMTAPRPYWVAVRPPRAWHALERPSLRRF